MEYTIAVPYHLFTARNGRVYGMDAHFWAFMSEEYRRVLLVRKLEDLDERPIGVKLDPLVGPGEQLAFLMELAERRVELPAEEGKSWILKRLAVLFLPYKLVEGRGAGPKASEELAARQLARELVSLDLQPLGGVAWLNLVVKGGELLLRGVKDRVYTYVVSRDEGFRRRLDEIASRLSPGRG